jgi:hypothetical protein
MFFDVKDVNGQTWTINADDVACLQPVARIYGYSFADGAFLVLRNGMSIALYEGAAARAREQLSLSSSMKAHGS